MYKINKYTRNSKTWRIKEKKIINKKKVELPIFCHSKSKLNTCIYTFYVTDITHADILYVDVLIYMPSVRSLLCM